MVHLNRTYALDPPPTHHTDFNAGSIPTSLTIPAGETRACLEGIIVDDRIVENTESFTLVITGVTPGGVVISGNTTVISITDNEGLFFSAMNLALGRPTVHDIWRVAC